MNLTALGEYEPPIKPTAKVCGCDSENGVADESAISTEGKPSPSSAQNTG